MKSLKSAINDLQQLNVKAKAEADTWRESLAKQDSRHAQEEARWTNANKDTEEKHQQRVERLEAELKKAKDQSKQTELEFQAEKLQLIANSKR